MENRSLQLNKIIDTYWVTHFAFFVIVGVIIVLNEGAYNKYYNLDFYFLWIGILFSFLIINLLYYKAIKEKIVNKPKLFFQTLYIIAVILCAVLFTTSFNFDYATGQFIFLFFVILVSLTCRIQLGLISAFALGSINLMVYLSSSNFIILHTVFYILIAWVVGKVSQTNFEYALEIQKQKILLDNVIDSFIEGIIITNSEGIVIICNKQVESMFNNNKTQLIGKEEKRLWPEYAGLDNITDNSFLNKEVDINNGSYLISRFKINIEEDVDEYYVTVINDITETQRQKKQLENLKMLSAIGEMASGVAHEIKNPLTTVKGFIQLMQGNIKDAKSKDMFGLILEELDRINVIIHSMLQVSKQDSGEFRAVNINKIIERTWDLYTYKGLSKGIKYEKKLYRDIPEIRGNSKQLQQVILNLLQNAERACGTGDKILIKTYSEEDQVCIDISDTGKGIPPEKVDKIMLPFYTDSSNGTGLGLAICNKIVSEHNGVILVSSELGVGTTITLKFKC
ncbi:MAG: PAS domain-containing protein [Firmicutes bacterium]|nr:PAS domain-containing protein [Bacillota bacterium]